MIKSDMKILFVTGNQNKLKESQAIMPEIEAMDLDLPEIQELESKEVIKIKLEEARKQKPETKLFVEDLSLTIDGINGLPGPLIKWFVKSIGIKRIYEMAKMFGNQTAEAKDTIGFVNEKGEVKFFEGIVKGKIVEPRGESEFGWDPIFIPDGFNKTYAEMGTEEKNKISHRKVALEKLKEYLRIK